MTNQKDIFNLIVEKFSGQRNILTVPTVFIDFMGSVESGLFLSQVLYWSDRTRNRYGWFYKTHKEWYEELRLSKYQVGKASKLCEEMGFLKTKVKKANGNPTVHYKLSMKSFTSRLVKFLTIESEVSSLTSNIDYIIEEKKRTRDEFMKEQEFKERMNVQPYEKEAVH